MDFIKSVILLIRIALIKIGASIALLGVFILLMAQKLTLDNDSSN